MKEKLLEIINHYGLMKQLKYIHSEYFELDEAIISCQHKGCFETIIDGFFGDSESKEHIAQEIADIMVMLKQFQYYYDIKEEKIMEIMESKIDRQLERINSENKSR